jgi:hypothetical protein
MEAANETLEAALSYAARGWSVIPISPDGCGKKPLVVWSGFQTKAADEAQIREWWNQWPDAGVAIVTGKISGLVVLDIDGIKVDDELVRDLFPKTLMATTPNNGCHLYYKYAEGLTTGSVNGIGVHSDGAYVVAPSTLGGGRSWTCDDEPSSTGGADIESAIKEWQ